MHTACPLPLLAAGVLTFISSVPALAAAPPASPAAGPSASPVSSPVAPLSAPLRASLDRDLPEITIPKLESLYREHRYTVTQVVSWYLDRIDRYNGVYRPIESVMRAQALAQAARLDAQSRSSGGGGASAGGSGDSGAERRGPLWGVPIVIKENTSIAGEVTSDGWEGFTVPGHELRAPRDATVVARLRAAGAVILGHTNMPDFANSDTNRSSSFGRTGNAYDVRYSPGGSSGGTVTAVTANLALLGNGSDTGNSIRMPSGTSSVVGVFPTRGLVSIAGIAPLDWLLDNTGPIARTVSDAALALGVMQGEDPLDARTAGSSSRAQPGPYEQYLRKDALRGKRFGVPAFILHGVGTPFHGIPAEIPDSVAAERARAQSVPLAAVTREQFLRALEELKAAGATIVMTDDVLPDEFVHLATRIGTYPYVREGAERFLHDFGGAEYHSIADYERVLGRAIGTPLSGAEPDNALFTDRIITQRDFETDPQADANYHEPRRRALAMYLETLDRLHLDGYVYPASQMPPTDETLPGPPSPLGDGPHSDTGWVNMLGVPAVVVPGGFYSGGLPFGLEFAARPWHDGDLLGYAYAFEQATHHRHPPTLVERGLLPHAP
jgi:Asp-tRNA(Asn)/Glu-tRNA(Gln) amidotransferase A subunit family amidase